MRLNVMTICGLLAVLLPFVATSLQGQSAEMDGWFKEPELEHSSKPQTQLTIYVQIDGNVVIGDYSVVHVINGETQGQGDIWRIPFRGRLEGGTARIEFNPAVTFRGPDQSVAYKPPTDGTKPGAATLTIKGDTLVWTWVSGAKIEGVPAKVSLRRVGTKPK